jgi:hypothetical protein
MSKITTLPEPMRLIEFVEEISTLSINGHDDVLLMLHDVHGDTMAVHLSELAQICLEIYDPVEYH